MLEYLVERLRKRVDGRGGAGLGIAEIDFVMESMGRFRSWVAVHRRLRSQDSRLSAASYEGRLADLPVFGDEDKDEFRRHLQWWDAVEAEVRQET